MISTLTKSKGRTRKKEPATRRKPFWAGSSNPELDRAGDWLLANLTTVRAAAASRAHPR